MITVQQAESILSKNVVTYPAIRVSLEEAFGQVLRENILADRDLPPFDRATMDGIAINSAAWMKGTRNFVIEGVQKAGIPALSRRKSDGCLEIMTGAMMPNGCDCIIPVEYVKKNGGLAAVHDEFPAKAGNCIHLKGSDAREGDVLLKAGCRLAGAQIAVAAAVGKDKIRVSRAPEIALVGIGDELVEINRTPKPFQIRRSNTCALATALTLHGYHQLKRFHIPDNQARLFRSLENILASHDVVILSGGVSAGHFDFVPSILKKLGVRILFHKVEQRPGGPLLFGTFGTLGTKSKKGKAKVIFGLPGNPVSTQICFYRYVLPYLNKSLGLPAFSPPHVALTEGVRIKTGLTYFLPVKLLPSLDGHLNAMPVFVRNSGDYVALVKSDGFIELSAGTSPAAKGSAWPFHGWASIS